MGSIWTVRARDGVQVDLVWTDEAGEQRPFSIWLKRLLTIGESRKQLTAGWQGLKTKDGDSEVTINWEAQSFAKVKAWMSDWSLLDDQGKKLHISEAVIAELHPDVYKLIDDAVTAHVERYEQEKKPQSGSEGPSPTSA
jgi:hypothetical protein